MGKTLHFTTACETFSMTLSMFIYILLQWTDLLEKIISKYQRANTKLALSIMTIDINLKYPSHYS